MLSVCYCKTVAEMCCRHEFLWIYFCKITIAYILQGLSQQLANGIGQVISESAYIGQVVS